MEAFQCLVAVVPVHAVVYESLVLLHLFELNRSVLELLMFGLGEVLYLAELVLQGINHHISV